MPTTPAVAIRRTTKPGPVPIVALAFMVVLGSSPVAALESLPAGSSVHDEVTALAAAPLGFEGKGLEALQEAVRRPDLEETTVTEVDGKPALDATGDYVSAHHCDRPPGTPHAEAFQIAGQYVRMQRDLAVQMSHAGRPERALRLLGNALHALQDCFGHSNIVDLGPASQELFLQTLLHGGAAPEGLLITSFLPEGEPADDPAGDPYTHRNHAKDGPDSSPDASAPAMDGRSKFTATKELAAQATAQFLSGFLERLNPAQREAIRAQEPAPPTKGLSVVGVALVVCTIAVGAALARQKG